MHYHEIVIQDCNIVSLENTLRANLVISNAGFNGLRSNTSVMVAFDNKPSNEVLRLVKAIVQAHQPPHRRKTRNTLDVLKDLTNLPDIRLHKMLVLWLARAIVTRPTLGAELGEPGIVGDEPDV